MSVTTNFVTTGVSNIGLNSNNQIVSSNGDVVGDGVALPAGNLTVRYVSNNVTLNPIGAGNTFRQIHQVPFVGRCLARMRYATSMATPAARTASFAAGRAIADTNPINAAGSAATWTVVSAVTPPTPANTTFANQTEVATAWVLLDVPAPTDSGLGGYIYTNTVYAAEDRAIVGNAARPTNDWGNHINALLPNQKYRAFFSAGDYGTTNQNAMPTTSEGQYHPGWLEVIPLSAVRYGVNIGDSTAAALGTGTPAVQPYNYNWAHIAAEDRLAAGVAVHVANFGHEGNTENEFLGAVGGTGRLAKLFANADFKPSFVIIQPASINSGGAGFDAAAVTTSITDTLNWCKYLRERNIVPILRTVLPSSGLSTDREARRVDLNNWIRTSGEHVFDLATIVSNSAGTAIESAYTYDGIHLNRAGNELGARHQTLGFARVLRAIGV